MFLSLIEKRRSIRKFQNKEVEPEKVDQLIEAALRSPSSRGFNPWEFVVVREKSVIEALSRAKEHGSGFLKNAPLAFVVCADENRSDVWVEDASIASIFIHLAAVSIGLGSCWIQIRKRPHDSSKSAEVYIQELLKIPAHLKVESIIAVGYPDEEKPPHAKAELQYDKVHYDAYGKKQ
ncbi:MAG: nitroreductase family protein [Deltaproteobacteria bacterium]|nr:nitroreductase family protein [Deltaproteobacteria bacterium]MBW1959981.1 nitroreductase family protein [Deltaproteobacteria bacterium]MBW2153525.1 nitroreductase family protein [Deltaproteobacteria bacterium]